MNRIDAHQHFWKFDPVRDNWITDEMSVIQKDFLPGDLKPHLQQNTFDGCVAIQAKQSEAETDFLISLATQYDFAWNFKSIISRRLSHFAHHSRQRLGK